MIEASGPRATLAFRALRHQNFRRFMGGFAVSLMGTWIQSVAQSWLLYRLTHSEFLLGVAAFCAHAPILFLGPMAGLAADRYPRQRIIFITQTLFLVQAAALAWLTLTGQVTVAQILVLITLGGCANAFDIPARQSFMILLTAKEDLLGAISLNSIAFNTARTVGPSVGGILVAAVGEGICFAVNAVSFLAVLASLLTLRMPVAADEGGVKDRGNLREGFHYIRQHAGILGSLLLCGAMTMASAAPLVLGPFIAEGIFHRGSQGLGILMACFGAGATLGVVNLAVRKHSEGLPRVAAVGALGFGASLVGYALAPEFWMACAAAAAAGYAFFRQNAANNALIQTTVEEKLRGRVMSIYTVMAVGVVPLGGLAAGWASEWTGPRPVLAVSGLFALAAGAAFYRQLHKLHPTTCTVS